MSNLREEILKLNVNDLQKRVDNIMLEINILLSTPEKFKNLVKKLGNLTTKLSISEGALNQAKAFYAQNLVETLEDQKLNK
jgi:hypothetical protein